ncbi:hypothetical protein AGR1B_pAt30324 [Agrobacterium fabacearum S56]|nr:hypothetical protein AGR1B_pAt30324 [Agrobacterium fabacearum S56]
MRAVVLAHLLSSRCISGYRGRLINRKAHDQLSDLTNSAEILDGNRWGNGISKDGDCPDHAEILSLVAEIDEFKGARRAVGQIAPERLSSLRHGVDGTQHHTTWQFR